MQREWMEAQVESLPAASNSIEIAIDLIARARRAVALTGAGISTPSGIPDFRSLDSGLWKRYNPMQVATLSAFRYRPEKFFEWLREVAAEVRMAQPNPAHIALAQLEAAGYLAAIVTQNMDGLHQRGGARRVYEVHGTLNTVTCIRCYQQFSSEPFIKPFLQSGTIPQCPDCNGILKPDIILFEEQLPVKTWMNARAVCRECDLMLVIGTSLEVMPVAGLPMQALEHNAPLILINHSPTYLDVRAEVILRENVAQVLPHIVQEVLARDPTQ
ncbi:MAG: NAD-dependent protein deacylase Cob2 [Anaerolineales bacterium]